MDDKAKNNADVLGGQLTRVHQVAKKLGEELPKEELVEFGRALDGGFQEQFLEDINKEIQKVAPEEFNGAEADRG